MVGQGQGEYESSKKKIILFFKYILKLYFYIIIVKYRKKCIEFSCVQNTHRVNIIIIKNDTNIYDNQT